MRIITISYRCRTSSLRVNVFIVVIFNLVADGFFDQAFGFVVLWRNHRVRHVLNLVGLRIDRRVLDVQRLDFRSLFLIWFFFLWFIAEVRLRTLAPIVLSIAADSRDFRAEEIIEDVCKGRLDQQVSNETKSKTEGKIGHKWHVGLEHLAPDAVFEVESAELHKYRIAQEYAVCKLSVQNEVPVRQHTSNHAQHLVF